MRLHSLTISNFRGFGPAVEPINLNSDLVLLYGPNGHGKTSLAEAIEWLFYGTTKRRVRGEDFSKAEYANTFANAHGDKPTEVSLKVSLGRRELELTRRLGEREVSTTFVDGMPADFASVGIIAREAHYPVVAQHGLQTFIHSRPKDRRDAICAALGLDDLTSLKSALESARSSFQRTPSQVIVEARKRLGTLAPHLARIHSTVALARKWSSLPPIVDAEKDKADLLLGAAELVGRPIEIAEDGLTALRTERAKASKAVLDISRIELGENHAALRATASARLDEFKISAAAVDDAVGAFAGAAAATYSAVLLTFWQKGLVLSPKGEDCPMCEMPTLTVTHRALLERRLEESASTVRASAALDKAINLWQAARLPPVDAVAALGIAGLTAADRDVLATLLEGNAGLAPYLAAHDAFVAAQQGLGHALRADKALGRSTGERCKTTDGLPALIQDRQGSRDTLARSISNLCTTLDVYENRGAEVAPAVAEKIASDKTVALIDAVGRALRGEADLCVLGRYAKVLEASQALIRAVEVVTQTKQTTLLKSRGEEVKALYGLLNPGASVGFDMMEPANDALKLHATSFGMRMPAAANLSECQLNCLGLAVWLMRATTASSPFGFILLDDPVQAMDDDHTEAFIAHVIPHLLDQCGKQVVVLSHVKHVIDKLRSLNMARDIRHYHYENFEVGGPVIVRQQRLYQMLAEIKGAANGNEANRMFSVDRLRVLVEEFVRELYLQKVGQTAPDVFNTANSGALADLFRKIPDTEPAEHAGMKDTIRFCDPAHHTQTGYSVPIKSNIQPHIDRVAGLMKKYCLISYTKIH